MSEKRNGSRRPIKLARGQLWKLSHLYVQIVELGKTAIQYRMLNELKEPGARVKTSSAEVLWEYLTTRRARLVQGALCD